MVYGIIGAMDAEVELIVSRLSNVQVDAVASMDFTRGTLAGEDVVIVAGRGGKVNAAVAAQVLIDRFDASALVFTGVAGALSPEVSIGDIVISTDTVQHDVDVTGFGYPLGAIPDWHIVAFEADADLQARARSAAAAVCPEVGVFEGRIATGDQFVDSAERKEFIYSTFGALCVEMEGAAVGQVAWLNHVPYIVIRAISDTGEGEAPAVFDQFLSVAAHHAAAIVEGLISSDVSAH